MAKKVKLSTDTNKRAKSIVDALTGGDDVAKVTQSEISRVMSELGKKGGKKGGKARAASLTPKRRSEIAKKAAAARWKIKKDED